MKINNLLKIMIAIIIVFVMSFGCHTLAAVDFGESQFNAAQIMIAGFIRNLGFNIFNMVQGGIGTTNNGNIVTIDDLVFDHFSETSINFYDRDIDSTSLLAIWKRKFRNGITNLEESQYYVI